MGFNLSETRFELVYFALAKLFSDEILTPILFKFVSFNLVPRLVEEKNELTKQLADQDPIIRQHQKEVEERRLAELERNRPKFLASNKGSKITLSENDSVATSTVNGWDNSFVAIKHPVKGKVVLTLITDSFNAFLGFFASRSTNSGSCYHHAQAVYFFSGYTQFWVNGFRSGGESCQPISKGQSIIIDFNDRQVTFSVPSVAFSHTVTWASGYVFGLVVNRINSSWKLSHC
ncbi:hypothetical protein RCL1_007978 [Eukaryota sp. TZLM3-RCL]